jgi:hypothetical protein
MSTRSWRVRHGAGIGCENGGAAKARVRSGVPRLGTRTPRPFSVTNGSMRAVARPSQSPSPVSAMTRAEIGPAGVRAVPSGRPSRPLRCVSEARRGEAHRSSRSLSPTSHPEDRLSPCPIPGVAGGGFVAAGRRSLSNLPSAGRCLSPRPGRSDPRTETKPVPDATVPLPSVESPWKAPRLC